MSVLSFPAYAQFRPIGAAQGSAENTPIQKQHEWLPMVQASEKQVSAAETPNVTIQRALAHSYSAEAAEPPAPIDLLEQPLAPVEAAEQPPTPAGLVEQPTAPVELVEQSSPSVDTTTVDDLWDRIRSGFQLGHLANPRVAGHEAAFASEPEYLARIVERSRRYLYHIVEEVEKRGMPMEIALLPIVESAFNPKAYSRARASGIWQFMPATGKIYGLQQNWWHDDRRDVHAATDAALDYLQRLHRRFNNWELALASYNSGEGRVGRAIAYNRARGLPTDFSSIQLPTETRNYVPKLIAVRNITRNPERFGLTLAYIPNKPYFTVVSTRKNIDLKRAAEFAEIHVDEFSALNPAFNRPVITGMATRNILVPAETADIFRAKLENPDQPLVSWRTQKLTRGEALEKVAHRFGISSSELKQVNGIPSSKRIAGGGMILVPVSEDRDQEGAHFDHQFTPEASLAAPYTRSRSASHVVKRGETLSKIARRYGVSTQLLQACNSLKNGRVSVGQRLSVRRSGGVKIALITRKIQPVKADKRGAGSITYHVKRGDTLNSIAQRFDVDVGALKRLNKISHQRGLLSGTRVEIPSPVKI
ncbi:MAG: LysM peptidoglycan-binding domain-containing protein [Burkholderiales bacterium]